MKKFLKWVFIGWTALWVFVLLIVVVAALLHDPVPKKSIVRVTFERELPESEQPSLLSMLGEEPPLSFRQLMESLRAAATDPRIAGVLLEVKDAKLSIAQIEELERAMAVVRGSGKWNAAFLETIGEFSPGNAPYAIAVTADEVVVAPPGDVNLTPLRAEVPFARGLFDKLEITPVFGQRQQYKTAVNLFTERDFTPAHRESLTSLVDDLQRTLVRHLAARRDKQEADVLAWIATSSYSAAQAKEQGIVDTVAYGDEVLAVARTKAERDEPFVEAEVYAQHLPGRATDVELALVVAQGVIMRGESNTGFAGDDPVVGSDTLVEALRDAQEDGMRGILLRVDSPGGSYVASDLIRRQVELVRKAGVPVVVSMGSVAASGGYFIAMDADRIVADAATLTGSIGVYAGTFATRRFFEDFLGITFGVYETMPGGANFSMLDPPDASERARREATLDRIYKDFVDKAAKGRNKSFAELEEVAKGRVWTGNEALAHGLIDEIGDLEQATVRLKELAGLAADATIELKPYPAPESPLTVLRKAFGGEASVTRALVAASRPLRQAVTRATAVPLSTPHLPIVELDPIQ